MPDTVDIRWKQRFANFSKAIQSFRNAILLSQKRDLTELEKQGLIQSFEYCHELAWNCVKDLLEHQGFGGILGSRDAMREAFSRGLISHGEEWMDMIKSRNLSSHTYNQTIADAIVGKIRTSYAPRFEELHSKLLSLLNEPS